MDIGLPGAETVILVRSFRQEGQKPGNWFNRIYVSSSPLKSLSPSRWAALLRGHWAGVEIRNHWRKDACLFEDKTRSRNPNIVGALALIRNALLRIFVDNQDSYGSLPAFTEAVAAKSSFALRLLRAKS